jgi:hydrogenase maturation protein HypF
LIQAVVEDLQRNAAPAIISRRFHRAVAALVVEVCNRLRESTGVAVAVLSGGVFLNALVTTEVVDQLTRDCFRVYRHRRLPPGDGGLSLGQLAIAAAIEKGNAITPTPAVINGMA